MTTTTVKFYAVNKIANAVKGLDSTRRDLTISALYHSLVHGNVAFLNNFKRADTASFDTTLRQYLPVVWQVKGEFYQFNADKKARSLEKLGIVLPTDTVMPFEVFAEHVLNFWNMNNQREKQAELDAQAIHDNAAKAFAKHLATAFSKGLTISEIETAVIMFKKEHAIV